MMSRRASSAIWRVMWALLLASAAHTQGARLQVVLAAPGDVAITRASVRVLEWHDTKRLTARSIGWRPGRPQTTWVIGADTVDVFVDSPDHDRWERRGIALDTLPREGDTHVLRVELTRRPRVQGVVQDATGVRVAARVWFEGVPGWRELSRKHELAPVDRPTLTSPFDTHGAACGFDLPLPHAGWVRLRAWAPALGFCASGPLHVDDTTAWGEPLTLTIDEPLATLAGMLLVPEGASAAAVVIDVPTTGAWWPVGADGRFEVRGLAPGVHTLRLLAWPEDDNEVYESLDGELDLEWFRAAPQVGVPTFVNDGALFAPSWHVADAALRVELAPGERRFATFDARGPAPCRLHGRLTLPFPVPSRLQEGMLEGGHGPRVTLEQRDFPGVAARAELVRDGSFLLAAYEPGRYRLRIDLEREGGPGLVIDEWVDLARGDQDWRLTLRTGSIELTGEGAPLGGWLVWRSSDPARDLVVRRRVAPRMAHAPAGTVHLVDGGLDERMHHAGMLRASILEVEVRAGERTELRRPR